jgi:hypothetical protein
MLAMVTLEVRKNVNALQAQKKMWGDCCDPMLNESLRARLEWAWERFKMQGFAAVKGGCRLQGMTGFRPPGVKDFRDPAVTFQLQMG